MLVCVSVCVVPAGFHFVFTPLLFLLSLHRVVTVCFVYFFFFFHLPSCLCFTATDFRELTCTCSISPIRFFFFFCLCYSALYTLFLLLCLPFLLSLSFPSWSSPPSVAVLRASCYRVHLSLLIHRLCARQVAAERQQRKSSAAGGRCRVLSTSSGGEHEQQCK